jgi:NADH dehydrogenase
MKRILVLGAGFDGLIAAAGAARKLTELKLPKHEAAVTVVNRDPWHAIRVRNYEADLSDLRVPLDDVLDLIGVDLVVGEVTAIDCRKREVGCRVSGRETVLAYDPRRRRST